MATEQGIDTFTDTPAPNTFSPEKLSNPKARRLLNSTIDKLQPRASRYAIRDTQVPGLELRIEPSGRKSWALRYRGQDEHGRPKHRRLSLGRWPGMDIVKARAAANVELRKLDCRIDPALERAAQAARAGNRR
jgi:hypothetical protein